MRQTRHAAACSVYRVAAVMVVAASAAQGHQRVTVVAKDNGRSLVNLDMGWTVPVSPEPFCSPLEATELE